MLGRLGCSYDSDDSDDSYGSGDEPDVAAVGLGQLLRDGQSESRACTHTHSVMSARIVTARVTARVTVRVRLKSRTGLLAS